jgi:hypothetical protein
VRVPDNAPSCGSSTPGSTRGPGPQLANYLRDWYVPYVRQGRGVMACIARVVVVDGNVNHALNQLKKAW